MPLSVERSELGGSEPCSHLKKPKRSPNDMDTSSSHTGGDILLANPKLSLCGARNCWSGSTVTFLRVSYHAFYHICVILLPPLFPSTIIKTVRQVPYPAVIHGSSNSSIASPNDLWQCIILSMLEHYPPVLHKPPHTTWALPCPNGSRFSKAKSKKLILSFTLDDSVVEPAAYNPDHLGNALGSIDHAPVVGDVVAVIASQVDD